MDTVKEEHQAKRVKEQAQRNQQPTTPILNKKKIKEKDNNQNST